MKPEAISRPVRALRQAVPPSTARTSLQAVDSGQWQIDYNNILRRVSFFTGVLFVFLKFSYGHEILAYLSHHNLYLLYLVAPPAMAGAFLSGGIRRTMQLRPARYWLLFAGCTVLSIPFSFWPGGSFALSFYYIRFEIPMMFVIAGTIMTWEECRKLLNAVAFAAAFDIGYGLTHRDTSISRMDLGFGTIGNANDFAAHLLLIMPLLIYVMVRPRTVAVVRIVCLFFIGAGLYQILRTGSRGALIAIALTIGLYLYRATMTQRLMAIAALPVVIAAVLVIMPGEIITRLKAFSTENSPTEAAQSREAREYLLRQSIRFSFRHPVFGVGMGQFSPYEDAVSRAETSQKGNWHETHNAYTQVSSENGLPALFFYLAGIFSTFGILNKIWRSARAYGHQEIAAAAFWLTIGLAGYCTAVIFLALAYRFYLPAFTGIAIALYVTADREFRLMRARAEARLQTAAAN